MTEPGAEARRAFLATRRRVAEERFDSLFAATYDDEWGEISPTHATMIGRLLDAAAPGGLVLDAACGTGKYWPAILGSGRRVVGFDQSTEMLAQAHRKFPDVPAHHVGFQELDEHERYDAVVCIDAMEYVGPEDWPGVLRRLRDAARPGAPAYVTVELADDAELAASLRAARARGEPVVNGEDLGPDGGYHHYPRREQVIGWLAEAGLQLAEECEGDFYWHLLLQRPDPG